MGSSTKIDWCDATWNPITGCMHGCAYCYAMRIAQRYAGCDMPYASEGYDAGIHELDRPLYTTSKSGDRRKAAYPFGFAPTLHRYRMDIPAKWAEPKTIFVCSMADLFGSWVPDEWIQEVFDACRRAPWHRYMFLTKNPAKYVELAQDGVLPRGEQFWYGTSITKNTDPYFYSDQHNCFLSVEPILESLGVWYGNGWRYIDWLIVGAETGRRKGKVKPEKAWIDYLVKTCDLLRKPIFIKESLSEMMGDAFKQEYPWDRPVGYF